MINWKHVIEGWSNHLFPQEKLRELIKETSDERLAICAKCMFHSSNRKKKFHLRNDRHCTICGCPEKALTKCLSCSCSLEDINQPPLWAAVITNEEEEQFNIECDDEND